MPQIFRNVNVNKSSGNKEAKETVLTRLNKMARKLVVWTSSQGHPRRHLYNMIKLVRNCKVKVFYKSGQTLNADVVDNVLEYGNWNFGKHQIHLILLGMNLLFFKFPNLNYLFAL